MDKIKFKRIVGEKGESLAITIPVEIVEYLDIKNKDEVTMTAEKGKHGRFIAVFKE